VKGANLGKKPSRRKAFYQCGRSSEVERQLPKLNVVGSIPIARSSFLAATQYKRPQEVLDQGAFQGWNAPDRAKGIVWVADASRLASALGHQCQGGHMVTTDGGARDLPVRQHGPIG
jgi:hypothetical protein